MFQSDHSNMKYPLKSLQWFLSLSLSLKSKLPCKAFHVFQDVFPPFQSHWLWYLCSQYLYSNTQLLVVHQLLHVFAHAVLQWKHHSYTCFLNYDLPTASFGKTSKASPQQGDNLLLHFPCTLLTHPLQNLFNWVRIASLHISLPKKSWMESTEGLEQCLTQSTNMWRIYEWMNEWMTLLVLIIL